MSVQALYSAATGMMSMETKLDVIANNLANVETTAFKRDRANFEDLFYRHEKMPGAQDSSGQYTPDGIAIGLGSRVSSVQTDFRQGAFQETGEAAGRGHRRARLLPGHRPGHRRQRLHPGGQLLAQLQRPDRDGLGQHRPAAGAADRHPSRRHRHRDHAPRDRSRSASPATTTSPPSATSSW